jgi:amino acid transporter
LIGGQTSDFLKSAYNIGIPYWVCGLIYAAILFAVLYFGVKISTRLQLILVLFSASIVTVFLIYVIFKAPHLSAKPFNPGSAHGVGNLFFGVLYAILLFVGFESAANLAEETSNPKRNIPRAVLFSVGIVTVYFVIASYAQAVGFGLDVKAWATSGAPVLVLAASKANGGYGSNFIGDLMNILLILDLVAVGIGASVAASRLLFSLARDRRVPGVFAKVSRRYGTPYAAILSVIVLTVGEIAWVRLSHGILPLNGLPEYLQFFFWLAQYGSLSLAVLYAAVSLAGLIGLWGKSDAAPLVAAVVVGLAITGLAIYSAIHAVPPPLNTVAAWWLGWAAIGVVITVALIATGRFRPSAQGVGALDAHAGAGEQVRPEF